MSTDGTSLIRGSIATLVGLTGVTVGMTWLFLGMRTVMEMGGSCASGGPYEIANPCPEGVPMLMTGGILGGIICLAVYGIFGLKAGPRLVLLAWPALFLSLGWNFFEYGLYPAGGGGADGSLLTVAVMFVLMGGVPLLFLFNRDRLRAAFWADPPLPFVPTALASTAGPRSAGATLLPAATGGSDAHTAEPAGSADDLSEALERLHQLHTQGALTAEEFAAAKQRLLG